MSEKQKPAELAQKAKKLPVWKLVAFGLCCIEQEYEVYRAIAKDRAFDMSRFLNKTVERFWQNAATGYGINEGFYLAIEESRFEPRDGWEELALQALQDLDAYFMAVRRKDPKALLAVGDRQAALLQSYLRLTGQEDTPGHPLILNARAYQEQLLERLAAVANKDKKSFLAAEKDAPRPLLLGEGFLRTLPAHPVEKPVKRKLPELRRASLEFDEAAAERKRESPDRFEEAARIAYWLAHWDRYRRIHQNLEAKGEDEPELPFFLRARAKAEQPDYIDFAHSMITSYLLQARERYLLNRDPAQVHNCWYLSALANWYCQRMYEAGVPQHDGAVKAYLEEGRVGTRSSILCAIACGEFELAGRLEKYAGQNERVYLYLLRGEDQAARQVLDALGDESLPKEAISAVLRSDAPALKKAVLKSVRDLRAGYEQLLEFLDYFSCAMLRIARRRGLKLSLPPLVELLEGAATEDLLNDDIRWELPGADIMDLLIASGENAQKGHIRLPG